MILKNYQINKINFYLNNLILFYGNNEGLKVNEIQNILDKNKQFKKLNYYEKEILNNENIFFDETLSGSLFEEKKIIIINNATDKIIKIIDEIEKKNLNNLIIIFNSEQLDKKSKLRIKFEKQKNLLCVAFYPDTEEILTKIAINFFKEKKIFISQININQIIKKCNYKRENLKNELDKIEMLAFTRTITAENISKLSNLAENLSIAELIDGCLSKNKKKVFYILNENNFNTDDSLLIIKMMLVKAKKLKKLIINFEENNNIENTIANSKPPIFWKDKDTIKKQIINWKNYEITKLIFDLNKVEYICKKNLSFSINIIINFIIDNFFTKINN